MVSAVPEGSPSSSACFFGGAGVTMPMGEYGDYAKTGWMGTAAGKVVPYLIGGLGVLNHKYKPGTGGSSESEWKLMFSGGGGLYFPMGTAGLYVEARYLKRGDTGFLPIVAGFTVGL